MTQWRSFWTTSVALLVGCTAPGPRTTVISQDTLQTLLAARFPYTGNIGPLFGLQAQAAQLAERVLDDTTLHQISAKDVAVVNGWGFEPGSIDVTAAGLRSTLNPPKSPSDFYYQKNSC